MRAALSAVAQWFRDGWNLPWRLKGPFLALSVVVLSLVVTVSVIVATGGDDTAVLEEVQAPTPTATAAPTSTPTQRPTHTAAPTLTPNPAPPPPAPPAPAPPPPAPEAGLTAAEVIECEFGQFDGWDDGFNLRPHGFTPSPASLKLTTDPVVCEDLWLVAYGDGYSRGGGDKCGLVYEYIGVASPEEIEFCSQVLGLPTPTQAPYVTTLQSPGEAIIFATGWMCCDADATLAVAVDNPRLYYSDLFALPQDCAAEFDINYLWWVVQCDAYWIDCFGFDCTTLYTTKPLCVSDVDYDDITPCGHVYGY